MSEPADGMYQGPERRRAPSPERRASGERRAGIDRRSGVDRRALDVGRGPGRRLADVRKSAEEGSHSGELWDFIRAIDEYKKCNNCPFPSYSQIFEIVKFLGYRKVADEARHINEVKSEESLDAQPADKP